MLVQEQQFNWDVLSEKEYWNLLNYAKDLESKASMSHSSYAHFPVQHYKAEVERKFVSMYSRKVFYKLLSQFIPRYDLEEDWDWLSDQSVILTGNEIKTIFKSVGIQQGAKQ